MKAQIDRRWLWRIVDLINPLRDPSLTVAVVLTFIEEAGQHDAWYWYLAIGLVNWLAVRGVVWLVVNFTFASTFISRRLWWAIKHPRLAWRILDAVGHEEIVIGGLPTIAEGMWLQNGTTLLTPELGANGIHVLGELPAGTEIPMLGMPNGLSTPDFAALANTGILERHLTNHASHPHYGSGQMQGSIPERHNANAADISNAAHSGNVRASAFSRATGMHHGKAGFYNGENDFVSQQSTDGLPNAFPQRSTDQEERLRQQMAAYSRLLDDWIQFTEEKWRTVSDSQLGWKPLRGRWGGWEDIFQDVYAAKTSDPMAQAALDAGEANSRRFENSKEKGSAASAVACFLRDMVTLRKGLEMMQMSSERSSDTPTIQPVVQPPSMKFAKSGGALRNGSGKASSRNTLIRRPIQTFVDADAEK